MKKGKVGKKYIVKARWASWWGYPACIMCSRYGDYVPATQLLEGDAIRTALGKRSSAFFKIRKEKDGYSLVKEVRARKGWWL